MEVSHSPDSLAARRVMLAASKIAGYLAAGRLPACEDLFVLSATVVDSAKAEDLHALELSIDAVVALLQQLPGGGIWEGCRGHLNAVMEFAWLWLRGDPAAPNGVPAPPGSSQSAEASRR